MWQFVGCDLPKDRETIVAASRFTAATVDGVNGDLTETSQWKHKYKTQEPVVTVSETLKTEMVVISKYSHMV